jgi:hypothetical protein
MHQLLLQMQLKRILTMPLLIMVLLLPLQRLAKEITLLVHFPKL